MQTRFQSRFSRVFDPLKPTFKIFIACDDQAALSRACKVESHVKALCGDDARVTHTFWSFSLLGHSQLRQYAAAEAANAEMVIVSLAHSQELPEGVRSLLESLPIRPISGQAALVALMGGRDEPLLTGRQAVIPYLKDIASHCGLDFFCNKDATGRRRNFQPCSYRPASVPLTAERIISSQIPWSAGGLND